MFSASKIRLASTGFVIPAAPTVQGSNMVSGAGVTIPTHAIGDLIIVSCVNTSNTTACGKPAAGGTVPTWIDIDAPAGSNGIYMTTVYAVATATNHTVGSWSNASGMTATVIRGQGGSIIGGHGIQNNASSVTVTAPSVTLTRTDGSSLILCIFRGSSFSPSAAPTGYTRVSMTQNWVFCANTKNSTTSDGSTTNDFSSAGTNSGAQIEICSY